jgi:poly-gamma-glutamate synthesis protein (capsule biosynthesis protein)
LKILIKNSFIFIFGLVGILSCANHSSFSPSLVSPEPLLTLDISKPGLFHQGRLTTASKKMAGDFGVSLAAVGDVMLGSWVITKLDSFGSGYPFEGTQHILQFADMAIANLEAPFTERGNQVEEKTFTFRVPPAHAVGLRDAGFDILHLANNHILDFGPEGLFDTIAILDSLSLSHIGAGENIRQAYAPVILERKTDGGKRLRCGFLGFSMTFPTEFYASDSTAGTAFPYYARYLAALDSLRPRVDFMVVSFHWGTEKMVMPRPYQIEMAHLAIDHGATLVIGHHPHVLQGVELYRPRQSAHYGLIAYSLGNFAFGSYSRSSRFSVILKCVFDDNRLLYARCFPINVFNEEVEFQPQLLDSLAASAVIDSLNALSRPLNKDNNILSADGFIVPIHDFWPPVSAANDSLVSAVSQ